MHNRSLNYLQSVLSSVIKIGYILGISLRCILKTLFKHFNRTGRPIFTYCKILCESILYIVDY